MLVLGVDPSLAATGYSWGPRSCGLLTTPLRGVDRLRWLRGAAVALVEHLAPYDLGLICYEEPPWGKTGGGGQQGERGKHEQAAGWWYVLDGLTSTGLPVALVNLTHVKMIATGKGSGAGSDKVSVTIEARDRLGYRGTNDNEADALWLSELGRQHLGVSDVKLPQSHLRALAAVKWPVPPLTAEQIARRLLA